jgi:hypothetical protein
MRCLVTVTGLAAAAILGITSAPSAAASQFTPGGYGYVVTGAKYTSSTADWTMPTLRCGSQTTYVAIWTGLDGYASSTVEQIGVEAYCSGETAGYFGWYEMYPSPQVDFSNTLRPGDRMTAAVTYASNTFTLTLDDATQGWERTVRQTLAGAARSSAETIVEAPSTLSCAPTQILANISGDTVDGTALGSLNPVKVTGDNSHIMVSAVNGKTFSVTCD